MGIGFMEQMGFFIIEIKLSYDSGKLKSQSTTEEGFNNV